MKIFFTAALICFSLMLFSQIQTQDSTSTTSPLPPDEMVFTFVEQMPEYPGGQEKMMQFIMDNLKYPTQAKDDGVMGKVVAQFIVKEDGSISEIKILRDIGDGCGDEVMRVIGLMPKWMPGKQNGKAVNVVFTLPVTFKLDGGEDVAVSFIGGDKEWLSFLKQNSKLKLVDEESSNLNEVILKFKVDENGVAKDVQVFNSGGKEADEEALRLFALIPKWNPATKNGKPTTDFGFANFPFKK